MNIEIKIDRNETTKLVGGGGLTSNLYAKISSPDNRHWGCKRGLRREKVRRGLMLSVSPSEDRATDYGVFPHLCWGQNGFSPREHHAPKAHTGRLIYDQEKHFSTKNLKFWGCLKNIAPIDPVNFLPTSYKSKSAFLYEDVRYCTSNKSVRETILSRTIQPSSFCLRSLPLPSLCLSRLSRLFSLFISPLWPRAPFAVASSDLPRPTS